MYFLHISKFTTPTKVKSEVNLLNIMLSGTWINFVF
jgi:hypothetical protein